MRTQKPKLDTPPTPTNNDPDNQSARRWNAICCLLEGKTLQSTADACSINVRTLRRWMEHPQFIQDYGKAHREHLEMVSKRLQSAADIAADTLVRLLNCGIPSVELRAARTILQSTRRDAEQAEMKKNAKDREKTIGLQAEQIEKLKTIIKNYEKFRNELDEIRTTMRHGTFKKPDWVTPLAWNQIINTSRATTG